jgi:predicted nucleotidyltransferase
MEKLKNFLKVEKLTEAEAIERLQAQMFDPAKDFYATLVSASRQLMDGVKSKTIDLDDPYFKALFQILQAGDKINKSLKLAQLEAYPNLNVVSDEDSEEGSLADRMASVKKK